MAEEKKSQAKKSDTASKTAKDDTAKKGDKKADAKKSNAKDSGAKKSDEKKKSDSSAQDSKAKKENKSKKSENNFLEYKGRPLVRSGDTIYYGSLSDAYVICLNVVGKEDLKDIKLASKVTVQLLDTDPNLSAKEQIVKKSEKGGLFDALDLGAVWLERALKK